MRIESAVFYTSDIENGKNFYENKIGLKIDSYQEGKFVSFLFENGVKLSIKKASEEREVPGKQTIFITADDIKSLFQKYKDVGFTFFKEYEETSWGSQFSVADPDNNKIVFVNRK